MWEPPLFLSTQNVRGGRSVVRRQSTSSPSAHKSKPCRSLQSSAPGLYGCRRPGQSRRCYQCRMYAPVVAHYQRPIHINPHTIVHCCCEPICPSLKSVDGCPQGAETIAVHGGAGAACTPIKVDFAIHPRIHWGAAELLCCCNREPSMAPRLSPMAQVSGWCGLRSGRRWGAARSRWESTGIGPPESGWR